MSKEATLLEIANILRTHFGDDYPFPKRQAPKFLFWLIAPMMGYTRKTVTKNIGIKVKLDNSYSKEDLGIFYIPIEQTIKEHFQPHIQRSYNVIHGPLQRGGSIYCIRIISPLFIICKTN